MAPGPDSSQHVVERDCGVDESLREAAPSALHGNKFWERYEAGELDSAVKEFESGLLRISSSPPNCNLKPRPSGAPSPRGSYVPAAEARCQPRLVLLGDELTQADPVYPSASFSAALAKANPGVMVDNLGFGGLCSPHLEDASETVGVGIRRSPAAVVRALAGAVHRVAHAEGCAVLPLFECCERLLREHQRERTGGSLPSWTPAEHERLRRRSMASKRILPWVEAQSHRKGRHAEFFKQLYQQPTLLIPWDIRGPQPDIVALQREHPEVFESPLLDVGAGVGGNAIWLAGSLGLSVVACDVSAEALKQARGRWLAALARQQAEQVEEGLLSFVECDALAETLPQALTARGPFATLLDSAVFHCISDEEDQRRYVQALASLIRPGGHLVMLAFSDRNPAHAAEAWQGPRRISQEDLLAHLCAATGWAVEDLRECRYCCASSRPPHGTAYAAWLVVARRLEEA